MQTTDMAAASMGASADAIALPTNVSRNFKAGSYERAAHDWYVEPRWCVEQLADALDLSPQDHAIYDPCCGGGTIPDVFRARGHETWATDIVDRGYEWFDGIVDALAVTQSPPANRPVSAVFNPPFSLAEPIVRAMLAIVDRRVCVLQQLSFLASRGRHALFTDTPPALVLILSKRPSMPPGALIADMGDRAFKGGTTDFCWIVWDKAHRGATEVRWLAPGDRA